MKKKGEDGPLLFGLKSGIAKDLKLQKCIYHLYGNWWIWDLEYPPEDVDQQDGNTLDYCIAPENLLFRWEQLRYEEGTLVFQLPYWLSLNTNCKYYFP